MSNRSVAFSVGRWIVLSAVGLIVGLVGGLALGAPIEAVVGAMLVAPIITAVAGLVLGAHQWFALRRHVAQAWWWLPLSAVGLCVGLTAGVVLVEQVGRALVGEQVNVVRLGLLARSTSFLVVGAITGASLGMAQAILLRRAGTRARTWVVASTAGMAASMVLGSAAASVAPAGFGSPAGLAIFLVCAGVLFGLITGRRMSVLLPEARP